MLWDRSNTGTSVIDPGRLARISGKSALTEFATSTAFAPACRDTANTTTEPGGLKPRIQNVRESRSSCTLWRTSATSHKCTVRPVELAGASVNCPGFDRASEIVHCQSARSEPSGIGFDSNRALNAVDIHL